MADTFRYRYGTLNPIEVPVDSATVIEIGDLLYLDTDDAKPASSQADQLTESANQRLFKTNFLGVALARSRSGDTDPIRVGTCGVYEFTCISASTYEIGDLIGTDEDSGGTALEDQVVKEVTTNDLAIGRVAKRESSAVTTLLITIESTIMKPVVNVPITGCRGPAGHIVPLIPESALQSLSGAGAINVTAYRTNFTSTGASQALTLADGVVVGQLKKVVHVVDGGSGVLTPTNFNNGTTITFTAVGEYATLIWEGDEWLAVELGNEADGATLPAIA